jgi:hypothetical protein
MTMAFDDSEYSFKHKGRLLTFLSRADTGSVLEPCTSCYQSDRSDKILLHAPEAHEFDTSVTFFQERPSPLAGSFLLAFIRATPVIITMRCASVPRLSLPVVFDARNSVADAFAYVERLARALRLAVRREHIRLWHTDGELHRWDSTPLRSLDPPALTFSIDGKPLGAALAITVITAHKPIREVAGGATFHDGMRGRDLLDMYKSLWEERWTPALSIVTDDLMNIEVIDPDREIEPIVKRGIRQFTIERVSRHWIPVVFVHSLDPLRPTGRVCRISTGRDMVVIATDGLVKRVADWVEPVQISEAVFVGLDGRPLTEGTIPVRECRVFVVESPDDAKS